MVDGIDGAPDTAPAAESEDTRELGMVLGRTLAGQSVHEIATALYGADAIAAEWAADSAIRSRTRRLIRNARTHMERGYRDLATAR